MFLWAKIPDYFSSYSSFEFCKMLIEKTGIAFSPGSSFGKNGEGFVRISLIKDEPQIVESANLIKKLIS